MVWAFGILAVLLLGPAAMMLFGPVDLDRPWYGAAGGPAGLAPDPAVERRAVVQIYGARAYNWRGAFAIHTWIAYKPTAADRYIRHEVVRWGARHRGTTVRTKTTRHPDTPWAGAPAMLLADLRGPRAASAIARIDGLIRDYPHANRYRAWPGPNSNTFIAALVRRTPELSVDFPPTAIGKDYLPNGALAAATPSGTGWQLSLYGLLGLTLAGDEGLEVTLLGLTVGLDVARPALKYPGIGRIDLAASGVVGLAPKP